MAQITPVVRSLWIAADFIDIAEYLPPARVASVRKELDVAVQGPLWPALTRRQPLQLQTQHWVAAILLNSGVPLEHARNSARRQTKIPEFYIADGSERIAIEVKRPESSRRIAAAVESARDKFVANRCRGGVVIEISDCLEGVDHAEFIAKARELEAKAYAAVWRQPGEGHAAGFKPGYDSILYIGLVARGAWQAVYEDKARLRADGVVFAAHFARTYRSMSHIRAERLHNRLTAAFNGVVDRIDLLPPSTAPTVA